MSGRQQVWLVRHGEGTHNASGRYNTCDPLLTKKGHEQASRLHGHALLASCDLLVVSPLSRAIQTAVEIFGTNPGCRTIITPLHAERCAAKCDEGRPKSELAASFPFIAYWEGFCELPEMWTFTKGTDIRWWKHRVPAFLAWLKDQPERRVVVVGHGAFFEGLIGRHLENCEVAELEDLSNLIEQLHNIAEAPSSHVIANKLASLGRALANFSDRLKPWLKHSDPVLRMSVIKALGKIGKLWRSVGGTTEDFFEGEAIAKDLAELFGDSSLEVLRVVTEAFGDIGEAAERHAHAIGQLLSHSDSEVRQNAAWALGQILIAKRDEAEHVASGKKRRLSYTTEATVRPFASSVARLLDDPDADCQMFAIESLGNMGAVAAEFTCRVVRFLKHENPEMRQNAAWSIGQFGACPHESMKDLIDLLEDLDTNVQYYAAEALGKLGVHARPYAGRLVSMLTNSNLEIRQISVWALGKLGEDAGTYVQEIAKLLEDPDATVREFSVQALGELGVPASSIAVLQQLLQDADPDVQRVTRSVLGKIEPVPTPCT